MSNASSHYCVELKLRSGFLFWLLWSLPLSSESGGAHQNALIYGILTMMVLRFLVLTMWMLRYSLLRLVDRCDILQEPHVSIMKAEEWRCGR
jgi:hypothetical protein